MLNDKITLKTNFTIMNFTALLLTLFLATTRVKAGLLLCGVTSGSIDDALKKEISTHLKPDGNGGYGARSSLYTQMPLILPTSGNDR